MKNQIYTNSLSNNTQVDITSKPIKQQSKVSPYEQRWDSVKPVRILISSIPAPWPLLTTLSEEKL